jgi:hypothetical protein
VSPTAEVGEPWSSGVELENPLDDRARLDARDDAQPAAAAPAGVDFNKVN